MEARPLMSGAGTKICLSNLPGRNNALSKISILLVAASTTTLVVVLNPKTKKIKYYTIYDICC